MMTINWYTLLDIDSGGRFLIEDQEGNQQRISMKWYADFIARAKLWENEYAQEEEIVWWEEQWIDEYIAEKLAEVEYNIRQEIKKENAILLESIEKLLKNVNNKK